MADRTKIIEMIAKMSRLTEDAGAFKGEASAAAAKIQELMEKYAISQMDVNNYLADKSEKEFKQAFTSVASEFKHKNIQSWEWSLARLIADVTITRCYSSGIGMSRRYGPEYGAHFVFFGAEENAKAATELYALWHENIEKMAEQARWANVLELKKKYGHYPKFRHWIKVNRPDEDPQYFRGSWIQGCISAMSQKVWEEREAREQERKVHSKESSAGMEDSSGTEAFTPTNASMALMLTSYREQLDTAYQEFSSVGFKKVKRSGSKGFSESGYAQGKATGSKIKVGSKQLD